ncbi:MAG: polyprenyl synthetase family protein [Candidatus Omnitrophica bacterium]|nr:polyprenyl synthetase family protein [Candidatus Omnitrophota bacterium]
MTLDDIYAPVREPLRKVPGLIEQALLTPNLQIRDIVRYFFSKNGKFLRPALVFLGGGLAGSWNGRRAGDPEKQETSLLHLGAACEIFHAATLIHDDIIDSARMRRGIPTLNVKWGPQTAVLMGDFFHDRAMGTIFRYGNEKIIPLFLRTAGEICDGEIQELNEKNNTDLTETVCLEIIRKKTASLLACALQTGALVRGMDPEPLGALDRFGTFFGMAFQLTDDCLDFEGKEQEFGKCLGGDLEEGVYTLPVIRLLASEDRSEAVRLLRDTGNKQRFAPLLALLRGHGALDYARDKARDFVVRAHRELRVFPPSVFRTSLEQLADYVLERDR